MDFDRIFDILDAVSIIQVATAVVLVWIIFYYNFWLYRGVPPGPRGLPLLGFWPFLKEENACMQMEELRTKYGNLNSITVTGHLCINLCSLKLIKEAHITNSDSFMERFTGFSLLTDTFADAVSIINGEPWRVQRKFYVQKFREFGLLAIKENFSGSVYDTINETIDELRATEGKPFPVSELLTVKCARIMKRILFNDQGITDEELKEINLEYQTVLAIQTYKNLLLIGNVARFFIFPLMPIYWAALKSQNRIRQILQNVINHHKRNFDDTQILDIIDSYLKERKDRESKGDPTAKYFTDKSLVSSVYQFLTDGILTIAYFIATFLDKLVEYPEEQQKIYEELLDVLGPDRQPTMDDKNKLPYTNAFIYEVMRQNDTLPMFPSLKCTKETWIQGYRIPEGSITVLNMWCANHDPEVYEDPNVFKPSRFLGDPGKPKPELPILFGIGKRACIGEAIVMIEVFLFVTTIVKNFHLTKPQQSKINMLSAGGLNICAHPRNKE